MYQLKKITLLYTLLLLFIVSTVSANRYDSLITATPRSMEGLAILIDTIRTTPGDSSVIQDDLHKLIVHSLNLAIELADSQSIAILYTNYSEYYIEENLLDSAKLYLSYAEKISLEKSYYNVLIVNYSLRGKIYSELGCLKLQADELLEVLEFAEQTQDKELQFIANIYLGNLYSLFMDFEHAKIYYNNLLKSSLDDSLYIAVGYQSIANIYEIEYDYSLALLYTDSALSFFPRQDVQSISKCKLMRISFLLNTGNKHIAEKEFGEMSIDDVVEYEYKWYYGVVEIELAYYTEHYKAVVDKTSVILEKFEKNKYLDNYIMERLMLKDIDALYKLRRSDEAMQMLKHYNHYRDEAIKNHNSDYVNELNYKFKSVKKENEIVQLKNHNLELNTQNRIKRWSIYFGVVMLIIILLILFLMYYRKRMLEQKVLIIELERKTLEEDLKSINSNIISKTILTTKSNAYLGKLIKELKEIKKNVSEENKSIVQSSLKKLQKFHKGIKTEELDLQLRNANKDFFEKLLSINDSFTQSDLNMCVYLKMNLQSKEICEITNQSYRTVEGVRSRIRQKLKLNSEDNLVKYLLKL